MRSFQPFRLDTADQCLWRGQERVAIPPKAYDVLRYLVENPGRLVTHDELLEKLWPEVYVNPEVVRKYILDIRKILGDRPDKPEFIETVTKRGYRFIAPVIDENEVAPPNVATAREVSPEPILLGENRLSYIRYLPKVAIIPILAVVAVAATAGHFRQTRLVIIQKSLSKSSRLGRGCRRFSAARCCRKAKFSRRRLRRPRKIRTSMPKQSLANRNMVRIYNKTVVRWQQLCY